MSHIFRKTRSFVSVNVYPIKQIYSGFVFAKLVGQWIENKQEQKNLCVFVYSIDGVAFDIAEMVKMTGERKVSFTNEPLSN